MDRVWVVSQAFFARKAVARTGGVTGIATGFTSDVTLAAINRGATLRRVARRLCESQQCPGQGQESLRTPLFLTLKTRQGNCS